MTGDDASSSNGIKGIADRYPAVDRREYRLRVFVECFNICYPDWTVGSFDRPLQRMDVEYGSLHTKHGRCGSKRGGRVYFGVNHGWADQHTPSEYLRLVIHELAHIKYADHSPAFWELVVANFERLINQRNRVETIVRVPVDWGGMIEGFVNNPTTSMVDNRSEIAYERRLKIAKALGYPTDDIEPFDGMWYSWLSEVEVAGEARLAERVPISMLDYDLATPEELIEWWHTHERTGIGMNRSSFEIRPVVAVAAVKGNQYRVIDGSERLSFVYHKSRQNPEKEVNAVLLSDIPDGITLGSTTKRSTESVSADQP